MNSWLSPTNPFLPYAAAELENRRRLDELRDRRDSIIGMGSPQQPDNFSQFKEKNSLAPQQFLMKAITGAAIGAGVVGVGIAALATSVMIPIGIVVGGSILGGLLGAVVGGHSEAIATRNHQQISQYEKYLDNFEKEIPAKNKSLATSDVTYDQQQSQALPISVNKQKSR